MRIGLLKRWLKGLPELEAAIAAEKGPFSLFALIEREDWDEYDHISSSWRLFVAAPWIWDEGYTAVRYLRERVRPYEDPPGFQVPELHVQLVKPNNPYLEEVWEYCNTDNGMVEVYNVDILDVRARRGYIFASRCPDDFAEIRLQAQLEAERGAQRQDQLGKEHKTWLQAQLQGRRGP